MQQPTHMTGRMWASPAGGTLPSAHDERVLAGGWHLFESPLDSPPDPARLTRSGWDAGTDCSPPERTGYAVTLPCDVHVPLIEAGRIPEPLEGLNTDACAWVEDRAWWFVNRFEADAALLDADRVVLSLDRMDTVADIFLNDRPLGRHRNAFRPFVQDVLPLLKTGENCLKIRITSGQETVDERELESIRPFVCMEGDRSPRPDHPRGDWRRAGLRKPQYVFGWDWGPRLATCGLGGPVRLVAERLLAIRSVHVRTLAIDWLPAGPSGIRPPAAAHVTIAAEVDAFPLLSTCEAVLRIRMAQAGAPVCDIERRVCLRSGWNRLEIPVRIDRPQLWWPNGMGTPSLYEAAVSVAAQLSGPSRGSRFPCAVAHHEPVRFGIRTIAIDDSPIADVDPASPANPGSTASPGAGPDGSAETERLFALQINGEAVFCKGGNWIPSDSLYLRIPDDKYRTLVAEAARSGYNMLRIWGGGFYETDLFHDLCDEAGILIWQDLMFACSAFPDHLAWFREECAAEIAHQVIRLRNHPGLVLWSGNNEIHSAYDGWWEGSDVLLPFGGMRIWNDIAPRLLHQYSPDTPYWNSSPYGGLRPDSPAAGDVHHWSACMMNPDVEKRIEPTAFDKVTAKFVSEYGYVGPCRLASIERYHGGEPVVRDSPVWRDHNNGFEKDTVLAGINKHYRDPEGMDLDAYLLYAGLCQGMMYGYSLEALRAKPHCAGAIYWMYNDTWGETGWTTIDYYLQRKISFPFVRRAFAQVKLILRPCGSEYAVTGINETDRPVSVRLAYGFVRFDGSHGPLPERDVHLPARSRRVLFRFRLPDACGIDHLGLPAVFQVPDKDDALPSLLPATWSHGSFRSWQLAVPDLSIGDIAIRDGQAAFSVRANVFAHAVHFGLDPRVMLSDEYFDLLPGESRRIVVEGGHAFLPASLPDPRSIFPAAARAAAPE